MKFNLVFIIIILSSVCLFSQTEKEINHQTQFWWSINSTGRFTDNWGFMGDFHIRRDNFIKDPNFYFLRLGAVYWVSNEFTIAAGLAHLLLANKYDDGFHFAGEKRIYQQLQWRDNINNLFFLFRVRNEQRWQEVLDENAEVDRIRFSNRVRFLFAVSIPVFENAYLPKIAIADEMLIHFGKEIVYNSLDQNRIFIGINQKISKEFSFDFGYMYVYQQKYSGFQYDGNHTLRWFFYYSPDYRDSKDQRIEHYRMMGDE